jgi:tRNA threonylcarbamoyl adenosine modification protein YeaZ
LKILGLETTERRATVALLDNYEVVVEFMLSDEARSASLLAPGIQSALQQAKWQATDLDRIAVTVGPGSFTGLRVGVTTAKTLAYALGTEVVGVNTLAVLASQVDHTGAVESVMDAQRNEVFRQRFEVRDGVAVACSDITIEDDLQWQQSIENNVVVTGPVLKKLEPQFTRDIQTAPAAQWIPLAATVARLGANLEPSGTPFELNPIYYRKSAAEEKRTTN